MRRWLLTLAVVIGCKDPPAPPPPAPPPSQDGLVLLEPGRTPKDELRYHFDKGGKTSSELLWDFDAREDGKPGSLPSLVLDLETTVEEVAVDGTAKLRIVVARASVRAREGAGDGSGAAKSEAKSEAAKSDSKNAKGDAKNAKNAKTDAKGDGKGSAKPPANNAPTSDLVEQEAAAMIGVAFTETLAPDGAISAVKVVPRPNTPEPVRARLEALAQSLASVALRFPKEAVGDGAKWRDRRPLPAGGIQAMAETIYELRAHSGDAVQIAATTTITGTPHVVEQEGTKVQVSAVRGTAELQATIDLSRYAPTLRTRSSFTAEMTIDAPKGTAGAGTSTVEIAMAIDVRPVDAAHPATAAEPKDSAGSTAGSGDAAGGSGDSAKRPDEADHAAKP